MESEWPIRAWTVVDSWHPASVRTVVEKGQDAVGDPASLDDVAGLAVDETAFLAAAATSPTSYVTGIVDVPRGRAPRHAEQPARSCSTRPDSYRMTTCPVPEIARLGCTLASWRAELLAYWSTDGASNGSTEAMNLHIKRIKRVGFGFRNFDNYRLRLLLHCGVEGHTARAAPVRGRLPRWVA